MGLVCGHHGSLWLCRISDACSSLAPACVILKSAQVHAGFEVGWFSSNEIRRLPRYGFAWHVGLLRLSYGSNFLLVYSLAVLALGISESCLDDQMTESVRLVSPARPHIKP